MAYLIAVVILFPSGRISFAQTVTGIRADGKIVRVAAGQSFPWLGDLTKTVGPEYPSRERQLNHQGAGIFRVAVDARTGFVINVTVLKSIGYERLDQAVTSALRQWRLKAGTWKQLDFPVIFEMARDRQDAERKMQQARRLGPTFLSR
jgi:TonB family protein